MDSPPKVYLHTFPPLPHVYSMSPFSLKVESWLRLHGIDYECVYCMEFGPKNQIPFVLVGDEVIADSNVIIARLITLFAASADIKQLTQEQRAIAHAATRMVEEHLAQTGFYYRYGLHMPEFYDVLSVEDRLFNGLPRGRGWRAYQPAATLKIIAARRLASPQGHSDEELWGFANDDLAALEALLGGRDFFFGAHASALDCAVFGQLIQFMDIPMSFPQQAFLKQHCPNLILFVERFRAAYWPDWEAKCEKQPKRPAMPAAKAAIDAIKAARKQENAPPEAGGGRAALLRRSSPAVGVVLLAAIAAWLQLPGRLVAMSTM